MPILNRRFAYTKVYRPNGTRYAEGRSQLVGEAVVLALDAFYKEFGYMPRQAHTNIEIMGVTALWVAQVFEIKE